MRQHAATAGVTNQQTVGAWARRQASDTSVHRWDAQNATGEGEPIAEAADYISEMFEHLFPGLIKSFGAPMPDGTLALRSTDTTERWTMTTADHRITITPDHPPADVTLSGTTSDLLLALWNRPRKADMDGDPRVLQQWGRPSRRPTARDVRRDRVRVPLRRGAPPRSVRRRPAWRAVRSRRDRSHGPATGVPRMAGVGQVSDRTRGAGARTGCSATRTSTRCRPIGSTG